MENDILRSAIDNLMSGICIFSYDMDSGAVDFEFINEGAFRMLGTTRASGEKYIRNNITQIIIPQDMQTVRRWIEDVVADNGYVETTFRYVSFQGALAYMRIKGNLLERHDKLNRIVCTFSDCSEEMEMNKEFEKQLNFLSAVIDYRDRIDYQVRTDTCVVSSGNFDDTDGSRMIPDYMKSLDKLGIHEDDLGVFREAFERLCRRPCKDRTEYRIEEQPGSGNYRWHSCTLMSILGAEGYVTHVLGLVSDIHEKKMEDLKLQMKADTDSLTQLLNKGATENMIRTEIEQHHEEKHMDALMMIDVDNFKNINDSFGHMIGDQVLHFIGATLRQNIKGIDVAGRIGGDEFMVFLRNIKSEHDTEIIAQHLQDVIQKEFADKDVAKVLSVSIGIAVQTEQEESYDELYREADIALYETKRHGKAGYTLYHEA